MEERRSALELLVLLNELTQSSAGALGSAARPFVRLDALVLVIHYARSRGALSYDAAPSLIHWCGRLRYAMISQEGLEDLVELESSGLIDRLEVSNAVHELFSGYRPNDKGRQALLQLESDRRDELASLIRCQRCHKVFALDIGTNSAEIRCPQHGVPTGWEEGGCLKIPDLQYKTTPHWVEENPQ